MIDLRSHTCSRPSQAMRRAMADAAVGGDVYSDDPTVRLLEERTAALLGKEIWPLEQIDEVAATARKQGLAVHLDGARLWHASAKIGVSEARYAAAFDTVSGVATAIGLQRISAASGCVPLLWRRPSDTPSTGPQRARHSGTTSSAGLRASR